MRLTEDQQLRLDLYKETLDIKQARELYDFITESKTVQPAQEAKRQNDNTNGVFIVFDDHTVPWDPTREYDRKDNVVGIGIRQGERSIVVALHDIGKFKLPDTPLANHITDLEDAVDDFKGKDNTAILEDAGLDFDLAQGWWIPSVGELLLIFTHIKQVNDALRHYNGTPLEGWHWASTSYGVNYAWYVNFSNGIVSNYYNRTNTIRVRPVVAFDFEL